MVMMLGLVLGTAIILFSIILLRNSQKRFVVKEVEGYYGIRDRVNKCLTGRKYNSPKLFRDKDVAKEYAEELNNRMF